MRKNGSVPVVIFVLSVFVVCSIAIFLFLTSDAKKEKEFKIFLDVIQESVSVEESVNFFINSGKNIEIEGLEIQDNEYIFRNVKYKPKGFFRRVGEAIGLVGKKEDILASVVYRFSP